MYLKEINILNYKNISESNLSLSPRLNCFIGLNGEGKTNLLDAVYYLSFCKSNYSSSDTVNIQHKEEYMMLKGYYQLDEDTEEIHCAVQRQTKKVIKRNGKEYQRLSEHIGLIPLVMIAPADISMIIGGSEERRKFIDSVISQYNREYLQKLVAYNNILAHRNKLLKDSNAKAELLMIFSEQMMPLANYIHNERKVFTEQIYPIFQKYYNAISSDKEEVKIKYSSHLAEGDFVSLSEENLTKDKILKYTTTGIHRDNLKLLINGYPIRKEGSQGQKKSYLLALKLAQYEFIKEASKKPPILLLDDIFDKLDSQRVTNIIKIVAQSNFGQIFITDTDKNHINDIINELNTDNAIFNVNNGRIHKNETE